MPLLTTVSSVVKARIRNNRNIWGRSVPQTRTKCLVLNCRKAQSRQNFNQVKPVEARLMPSTSATQNSNRNSTSKLSPLPKQLSNPKAPPSLAGSSMSVNKYRTTTKRTLLMPELLSSRGASGGWQTSTETASILTASSITANAGQVSRSSFYLKITQARRGHT